MLALLASLNRKLDLKVLIPDYPDYVGALGAALAAANRAKEPKK